MSCRKDDYPKVATIISKAFGIEVEVIDVCKCPEGTNQDMHFEATTKCGQKFGLKLFAQTGSDMGAERDKLMADIAGLVGIPNACRVERSAEFDFIEVFQGKTVSITKWLPGSKSLKKIDNLQPEIWIEIIDSHDTFHFQAGQWMAFGYLLCIADRGNGNFVWNHAEKLLAMIDMEFALAHGDPRLTDFNELMSRYVTKKAEIRNLQLGHIEKGFCAGWEQILAKEKEILELLQKQEFSKDYKIPSARPGDEIIREFLSNYAV